MDSNQQFKEAAARQTTGNIIMLFLVMLLWGLILSALEGFPAMLLQGQIGTVDSFEALADVVLDNIAVLALAGLVMLAFVVLAGGIMEYGMIANQRRMFERKEATIDAGFSGFRRPGISIGTFFMRELRLFLWFLIPIAGLVIVFIKYYAYACAFYTVEEDSAETANGAISRSVAMMDGKKFQLFCLDVYYFFMWYVLLGTITFGIALVWGIPRHNQARYNFYQAAKTDRERQSSGLQPVAEGPKKYY